MKKLYIILCAIAVSLSTDALAQLTMYAGGTGIQGSTGDGGPATAARIYVPTSIVIDNSNNLYLTDQLRMRKIDGVTTIINTIMGNGVSGYGGSGIPVVSAQLGGNLTGMAFDASGNLIFSDAANHRVRMLSTGGIVTTIAGDGTNAYIGDGVPATATSITNPYGVAVDNAGNVYFVDQDSYRIRKIDASGIISTVIGDGIYSVTGGGDGGPATAARISSTVNGLAADGVGNLYISDNLARRIRKIDAAGIVTTIAGNGGSGYTGDGGPATAARMSDPQGIIADRYGNVFFVDRTDKVVRRVDPSGIITTVVTGLATPIDLRMDNRGYLYISETGSIQTFIMKFAPANLLPSFTGGTAQSLSVCEGSGATAINTLLTITDANVGQTETWSAATPPAHGVLSVSYTAPSSGSTVTPTGLTYTPNTGYSGSDMFVVRISDGTATATTTINVTVTALPAVGTITGASVVCEGANVTLGGVSSGGAWSSGDATVSVSGGTVTGITTGTGTISYSATNSCGTSTATHAMTVNPLPFAGTISGPATVCIGSSITLTDATAGGVWTSSGAAATVNSSGMVSGVSNGTVTISYTVTNSCGNDIATQLVTSSDGTFAGTITGPTNICAGTSVTMTGVTPGGTWSSSTTRATVNSAGMVAGISAGSATLMYVLVSACGTATTSQTINILPAAFAGIITGPTGVCLGSTTTIGVTGTGGTWGSTNGYVSISAGGTVTGSSLGVDTILYTVTNSCGTAVARKPFSVKTTPVAAAITGPADVCIGGTITLANIVPGGFWTASGSAATVVAASGVVSGISAGSAVISYMVIDLCGTAVATLPVNVIFCHPAGITDPIQGGTMLQVQPNPNYGSFSVNIASDKNEQVQLKITDLTGRILGTYTAATNTVLHITLSQPAGIYLLSATMASGQYTARIVVE